VEHAGGEVDDVGLVAIAGGADAADEGGGADVVEDDAAFGVRR
jgi:hypothetical protein